MTITKDHAEFTQGKSTIQVSIIQNRPTGENPSGVECWIHDLEGEGMDAVQLMARARKQAKEWGFEFAWANINNPRLSAILMDHGWPIKQTIHQGRT